MRIAIAGLGQIGDLHYSTYKTIKSVMPEISIDAVCDKNLQLLSKYSAQGIRTYTDYNEMLGCESLAIDMVDICVPTFLHKDYSIKALDAGYAVICEKPMALDEDSCRFMAEASHRNAKLLMVAHPMRFFKAYEIIKKYIDGNLLGKLTSAFFNRCDGRPARYDSWFYKNSLSGGIGLDLLIHDADAMQWLLGGLPDAVSAAAHRFTYPSATGHGAGDNDCYGAICDTDNNSGCKAGNKAINNTANDAIYDSISANLIYNNQYVNLYCDWTVEMNMHMKRFFRINFENGYLIYDNSVSPTLAVMSGGNLIKSYDLKACDPYAEELKYFINCLKNGTHTERCMPENSLLSVKLCSMIKESIITVNKQ